MKKQNQESHVSSVKHIKNNIPKFTRTVKVDGRKLIATALRRNSKRRARTFLDRVVKVFSEILTDPTCCMLMLLSAVLSYEHMNGASSSMIKTTATMLSNHNGLKFVGEWITANERRVLGLLVFLPTFYRASRDNQVNIAIIAFVVILLAKPQEIWHYTISSCLLHLYSKLSAPTDRMIVIAITMVMIYLGILFTV